jgi:hypothetical protein
VIFSAKLAITEEFPVPFAHFSLPEQSGANDFLQDWPVIYFVFIPVCIIFAPSNTVKQYL